MTEDHRSRPHLPGRPVIDAYGKGGFRFGDMSHRGSILCLPSGVYAWEVASFADVTEASLAPVLAERAEGIEFLLIGTGAKHQIVPDTLRWPFRAAGISVDAMDTGAACRIYNIMLAERRPVAAALIAVDAS